MTVVPVDRFYTPPQRVANGKAARWHHVEQLERACAHLAVTRKIPIAGSCMPVVIGQGSTAPLRLALGREWYSGNLRMRLFYVTARANDTVVLDLISGANTTTLVAGSSLSTTVTDAVEVEMSVDWSASAASSDFSATALTVTLEATVTNEDTSITGSDLSIQVISYCLWVDAPSEVTP